MTAVERVLADINSDNGNRAVEVLRHGVLLVFGAPCRPQLLTGQEHGRTIPLSGAVQGGAREIRYDWG